MKDLKFSLQIWREPFPEFLAGKFGSANSHVDFLFIVFWSCGIKNNGVVLPTHIIYMIYCGECQIRV